MRSIVFDPATLADATQQAWWAAWQKSAETATRSAIEAWEAWYTSAPRPAEFEHAFSQAVWKALKSWLLERVFRFKCAYCESPLDLDRYHGDAEHFRPKGRVTVVQADGVRTRARCTLPDGTETNHPGYFWLAYHWHNLVPACAFCNSGEGKVDQFPTAVGHELLRHLTPEQHAALPAAERDESVESPKGSGWYLLGPRGLDAQEQPLLLNPLNPDPARIPGKHLRYGLLGKVVAIDGSELGEESIRVYKLDRGRLEERRRLMQEEAHRIYYSTLLNPDADLEGRLRKALHPFVVGERDYASAALAYVKEQQRLQRAATDRAIGDG